MEHHNLYTFTKLEVGRARALARSGHKDQARNFLRYVQNSSIIKILNAQEFPKFLNVDVALLAWEISQLEAECHPGSACDQSSDIEAIHAKLEVIAGWIAKQTLTLP